ncbi:MAG TPA: P1 family peptidase [Candidatus Nitrosocosmicus sp.]|nr:P1 family peptidase [Candidatus Nitrosocosmicus sp.]
MIPGVRVGHATDPVALTGCTVILPDRPAVGGVEIRGWAAGVHGLEFLDPRHLVPHVDAVVLAGGSAYGLEAIWGVMQYLEERGVGFPVTRTVVPHVAGAILFDLGVGDHRVRPDRAMGYAAAQAARPGACEEGNVGAGTGATVGKLHKLERAMRGGLGCAVVEGAGFVTAAIMAVNAVGDVRDAESGRLVAGARDAAGERLLDTAAALAAGAPPPVFRPQNTTIGCVITDARLGKAEASRVAALAMGGYARALSPPHLTTDGDTLFCLSIGDRAADPLEVGTLGARAVAQAILRGVRAATGLPGLPAARDLSAGGATHPSSTGESP